MKLTQRCTGASCPHEPTSYLVLDSGRRVPICDGHAELLRFKGYEVECVGSIVAGVIAEEKGLQR